RKNTNHPGIRDLCDKLKTPHDVINAQYSASKQRENLYIKPLAKFQEREPRLERPLPVERFDDDWQPLKASTLAPNVVKGYIPYEVLAQELVEAFLKDRWDNYTKDSGNYLSRRDMLAVADRVLSEIGKWHDSESIQGVRQGEEWEKVKDGLEKKI